MIRARRPFLVLLLVSSLVAPALGDGTDPTGDVSPEDFVLLPISDIQRDYLLRDHPALAMRAALLGKRAERIRENLAARADPSDDGGKRLAAEIESLREQARGVVAEMRQVLPRYGIPLDAFDRVRRAPRGPLREERYAHALVLEAPGLDVAAAALLRRVVPAVEGALLALHAQRRGAEKAGAADAAVVADATARADAIETRFWRTVDVLVDDASKRWVRERLPGRLSDYADVLGHLFRLPEMTPSQGVRLKALLVELDAEAQADTAEVRRIEARLAESGVPDSERRELEERKKAAYRRATDAKIRAFESGMALLTPEQVAALRSIPPRVTADQRAEGPGAIVKTMDLAPAQVLALADVSKSYEGEKRRIEGDLLRVHLAVKEQGPDSPRQDETMMAYAGVQSRVQRVVREATREIFLSLLTPDQVVGWVVGVER